MNRAADIRLAPQAEPARRDAFAAQLESWRARMEAALAARLPDSTAVPTRLHQAMRYSVLGGGKRVRPMLLFASARTVGLAEEEVEAAACAIELVHVYSLVHDDLPAFGMAGGQAIDLAVQGRQLGIAQVEEMHARKTGALIRASVLMAAACVPSLEARLHEALSGFATPIGLAFQIQDDLLDVLGDPSTLGKATGADRERAKPTHPAVIGIAASQERVRLLHAQAVDALSPFGERAQPLRSLADWLLTRRF